MISILAETNSVRRFMRIIRWICSYVNIRWSKVVKKNKQKNSNVFYSSIFGTASSSIGSTDWGILSLSPIALIGLAAVGVGVVVYHYYTSEDVEVEVESTTPPEQNENINQENLEQKECIERLQKAYDNQVADNDIILSELEECQDNLDIGRNIIKRLAEDKERLLEEKEMLLTEVNRSQDNVLLLLRRIKKMLLDILNQKITGVDTFFDLYFKKMGNGFKSASNIEFYEKVIKKRYSEIQEIIVKLEEINPKQISTGDIDFLKDSIKTIDDFLWCDLGTWVVSSVDVSEDIAAKIAVIEPVLKKIESLEEASDLKSIVNFCAENPEQLQEYFLKVSEILSLVL